MDITSPLVVVPIIVIVFFCCILWATGEKSDRHQSAEGGSGH